MLDLVARSIINRCCRLSLCCILSKRLDTFQNRDHLNLLICIRVDPRRRGILQPKLPGEDLDFGTYFVIDKR